jgi:NDP-sugar pyrophosphorylase family protein
MLQKRGISFKKTLYADARVPATASLSEKEAEIVQLLKIQFWLLIQGIPTEKLIFLDEAGANLSLIRRSARAQKSKRAHSSRPQKRSKNVSIIGAIGLKGVISQYSFLGATDGLAFEAYISRKLVPKLEEGDYVIMDNCSIHKGKEIEKNLRLSELN